MPTNTEFTPEQIAEKLGVKVVNEPATDASTWRSARKEGFIVELPSGNRAKVRRTMDLFELVKTGKIPNKLIKFVQEMIDKTEPTKKPEFDPENMDPEVLQEMTEFMAFTCCQVLIEPKCFMPPLQKENEPDEVYQERLMLWEPPEGAISVTDLSSDDQQFLFNLSQGGTGDLEPFRDQQKAYVAALQDVGKVPTKAKRTTKSRKK